MIISRSQKLTLILLLLLAVFITACGGGTAPIETEAAEATEAPATQARATAAATATQVNLITDPNAVADTFPCNARMVDDQGNLLRVLMRQPSATAPLVGARRGGQDVLIDSVVVNEEGTWYAILENRQVIGYVLQQYILLAESCVTGTGGAEAEASAEATEEATAETTQEG